MEGRSYAITFGGSAITAQQDLFSLQPADDKVVQLISVRLGQISDLKDIEEEGLRLAIRRGATVVGSAGAAFTPLPLGPPDTAAGASVRINDTVIASSGTIVSMVEETWNNRIPFMYIPVPEERIWVQQGVFLTFNLLTTPADAMTMQMTAVFREIP